MKSLLLLLISLTCFTVSATPAPACQCDEYGTPVCAAYWRATAVFVGQVRDISPVPKTENALPSATVHFIVEQPFRGANSGTIDVETLYGTTCDTKFVKGVRYLVYAYKDDESGKLYTGFCTRTTEFAHADEDLNYIRSVMQQSAAESVAGRVERLKYEPIPGAKIQVRNGIKTFEATADENGDFSISLPGPGTYTVTLKIPASLSLMRNDSAHKVETTDTLTTIEYKVELEKSECDYRQFDLFPVDLHATAEISGSVLTATGRPVDKGYVHLINAADTERSTDTKIEQDGAFKFEGIAAGEYFLALNPRNRAPDADDPPFARVYYPSAADVTNATKIVVTEGAKLENLTLRVGPAWKARTVSGKVVWKDGGAAVNAQISLYDGDRYIRMIEADKKGYFNFKIYGDFKYAILGQVWGKRSGESDRVAITEKSTNLTIVIEPR